VNRSPISPKELPIVRTALDGFVTVDGTPSKAMSCWEFLNFRSNNQMALVFATLFWPEFVVVDRLIFLAESFLGKRWVGPGEHGPESVPGALQRSFNHLYIYDIFGSFDDELDETVSRQLAIVLSESWLAKSSQEFPTAGVLVEVSEGSYGPQIELWQREFCD
jgi:hypothetical protein